MGAGIAQVSIDKNMHVFLKDMSLAGLARGEEQIFKGLQLDTKKRKITRYGEFLVHGFWKIVKPLRSLLACSFDFGLYKSTIF